MNARAKKRVKWILIVGFLVGIYPLFVLGYTWILVFKSDFQGGKNGPLDAYRHTLASAIVAYTVDDSAVKLFTELVESRKKDSGLMDRHNNMIGAKIGSECKSFGALELKVRQAVLAGSVNANKESQITWLPEEKWKKARFW